MPNPHAARVAVVHDPAPAYPAALFTASVNQGHAIVACTIGDEGSVLDLWTIESSNAAFADAAEGSLREWRYQPAASSTARHLRPVARRALASHPTSG